MRLKFEYLNREYEIEAEKQGSVFWFHFQGETFAFEPKTTRRSVKVVDEGVATAPMPGKVTKVMFSIGNPVSVGQVVVVMEAMKMEYSLKADTSGILKEISCSAGDQVVLGQKLFEISKGNKNEK